MNCYLLNVKGNDCNLHLFIAKKTTPYIVKKTILMIGHSNTLKT